MQRFVEPLMEPLARGYEKLYKNQRKSEALIKSKKDEFFGLRDFYRLEMCLILSFGNCCLHRPVNFLNHPYALFISSISLVKMVYKIAEELDREPAWKDIERAIRRSFGGLEDIDPVKFFGKQFPQARRLMVRKRPALDGITRRVILLVTQYELRPTAKPS